MHVNEFLSRVHEIKPQDDTYTRPDITHESGDVRDLTKFRITPGKPRTKQSENNSYT